MANARRDAATLNVAFVHRMSGNGMDCKVTAARAAATA